MTDATTTAVGLGVACFLGAVVWNAAHADGLVTVTSRLVPQAELSSNFVLLPVLPLDLMALQKSGDGNANSWKEILLAKLREQAEPLQLVLYGIFELGKAKFYAFRMQCLVQFAEHVAGGDVNAGDRLRRDDQPAYLGRRFGDGIQRAFLEKLS